MARERQQYSGDGGHQLHALYHAFNENRLPGRFVNTFSQGATADGYFLDCWPAFDRVWRVAERNLSTDATGGRFSITTWVHFRLLLLLSLHGASWRC